VSDLVEFSAAGNHLVELGSCRDSQRGLEVIITEVEGLRRWKPLPGKNW
jgi:hypothetical protein